MKKRICIIIPWEHVVDKNTLAKDIKLSNFVKFNNCNIIGAEDSLCYCAMLIYLSHTEFNEVGESIEIPRFHINDARRIFPYLFSDTNPILYRKY